MAFFSALIAKMGKRKNEEAAGGGHEPHDHKHQSTPLHPHLNPQPHPHPYLHRHACFARIVNRIDLYLRILTLAFLVAGIVVLAVNQLSYVTSSSTTIHFLDLSSFKYILAAIIISQTYLTVQIIFTIFRILTGIERGIMISYFDFFGDKILTYILASGAAAAFGASIDGSSSAFINRGKIASTLVLIAFFFSAISSIISSHSLPKHLNFFNLL